MRQQTDASLAALCLQGEDGSFSELLRRYRNRIYGYLVRLVQNPEDAEDLAQETFVRIFSKLDGYKPHYPFSSWAFGIAHNLCMDFLRKRRPELSLAAEDCGFEAPDSAATPEAAVEIQLSQQSIEHLLAALPLPYREVVLLRYKEDLSCEEVSRALSIPEGTVKVRLFRARKLLKEKLELMNCRTA